MIDAKVLEFPMTPRELEVAKLLVVGRDTPSIARTLGISAHTAKFHVGNLVNRSRAVNRTHLAAMLALTGVVDVTVVNAARYEQSRERVRVRWRDR